MVYGAAVTGVLRNSNCRTCSLGTACNIKRWLRAVLREVKEVQTRGFGLNLGFQHVRQIISDALSHIFDQSLSRNFSWRPLPLRTLAINRQTTGFSAESK